MVMIRNSIYVIRIHTAALCHLGDLCTSSELSVKKTSVKSFKNNLTTITQITQKDSGVVGHIWSSLSHSKMQEMHLNLLVRHTSKSTKSVK
jgi:hypothetical protein